MNKRETDMSTTASDAALLAGLLAHSNAGWGQLLRRHSGAIKRRVAFLLSSYGLRRRASDTFQEILAEFYLSLFEHDMRKLRAFDASRGPSLVAWLVLLAERHTHNHLRALKVRTTSALTDARLAPAELRQGARWCGASVPDAEFSREVASAHVRLDEVV